jgi:lipid kinase YegS
MATWLVLNGKKAGRDDVRAAVGAVRRAGHALEVRVTWERGDAARIVTEAVAAGADRIIAGGGDGSVNELANGLMAVAADVRPALGILPLGTANDFATACRVPTDAEAAVMLAVTGEPVPVDLGSANGHHFVNVASGGFGAAITAETPVELKNFLGGGAYTIMGLVKAIDFRPYACTVTTPEGAVPGQFVVAAICNGRQAGGGQPLAPAAVIDDGLLDVVFLRPFSVATAPQVAAEIIHGRPDGEYVVRRRVPWIEVAAEAAIPVNLDGEPISAARVRFAVEPGCLRLVLPPGCPCLQHAARPGTPAAGPAVPFALPPRYPRA